MGTIEGFASESGHWYDPEGKPAYEIVGANGNIRPTTLRDARKLGLFPSVTTITKVIAAPALVNWILEQNLDSALTLPRFEGEMADDFKKRVKQDAKEQGQKAMALGTAIHAALEQAYTTGLDIREEFQPHVVATIKAIAEHFGDQTWKAERSFAHSLGFGGKIDLHSRSVVIDFKTKSFTRDKLPEAYDEQVMQLSAYGHGLKLDPGFRAANVFVSTIEPGLVHIVEHEQDEISRGWAMFDHALAIWKLQRKL